MLTVQSFPTFERAYGAVLDQVVNRYWYRNAPRGIESREVLNVGFQLNDPIQRVAWLGSRRTNVVFCFAEALWFLWGRDDLAMMAYYAPRMRAYSRDQTTITGASYGTRLFGDIDEDERSQFDRCLELIRGDPATKRSFMVIFRPWETTDPAHPDVSCAVGFQLLARDGLLNATCYMRANDAMQGLVSDVFSFTLIQEFAARLLGLDVGVYGHLVGSMHLGVKHLSRAQTVLDEIRQPDTVPRRFRFPAMPTDTGWDDVQALRGHEYALRTNEMRYPPWYIESLGFPWYWQQVLLLFECYRQIAHEPEQSLDPVTLAALDPGFAWLVRHRWPSRMPTTGGSA